MYISSKELYYSTLSFQKIFLLKLKSDSKTEE